MSAEQRALTERIAAIDQQAMAEGRIVGSVVLVARQGEICYAGAAGYADREVRRPMRRETQFRLSSVSKPYTTLAALRLIEQGKLSSTTRSASGCRGLLRRSPTAGARRSRFVIC